MARDYGKRPRGRKSGGARSTGLTSKLLWLGGGLAGGLVLGYAGYHLTAQVQQQHTGDPTVAIAPAPPTPAQKPAPAARPTPPFEPKAEQAPRFDFYTLLPEMEVEITDDKLNEAMQALPKSADRGPYILQVGSFRRHDEADNLKARLALLGIEASIQTVIIRDDDIWYRVRVGPYNSIRDLAQVRNRLNRNNIQHMLLRIGA
jgi:cell division protein FtsN